MNKPILHFTTYSVSEAAERLNVSVATIRRAIKLGKLEANKLGDNVFRIHGEALLKYAGLPVPDKSQERVKLVEEFNEAVGELYPVIKSQPAGSMSVFLHQAINLYVCDDDLRKIVEDVRHYKEYLSHSGRQ